MRLLVALVLLGACSAPATPPTQPTPTLTTPTPSPPAITTPTPTTCCTEAPATTEPPEPPEPPEPGTVPPEWLGTIVLPLRPDGYGEVQPTPPELAHRRFTLRDTVPELGRTGFRSAVEPVPADVLARSTWQPDCPVAADELRWVRLSFWGFDGRRHTGELLVNASVAGDVVSVFGKLFRARYPIEEMRITRLDELDAPPTGDGNNTGAFACRPTVGQTTFSQHAYGLAIDVNPFQNPYEKGDGPDRLVLPELASSYLDRDGREGVIHDGDPVVRAFAAIGWEWGGDWRSLKDYQHFSLNGT